MTLKRHNFLLFLGATVGTLPVRAIAKSQNSWLTTSEGERQLPKPR
ncbi:hypothetical protein [Myxosarcina sp. GI1(2024)]